MKSEKYYPNAEDDAEATLVGPRFNEEAKEAARPVVPLSQVTQADLYAGVPARRGGNSRPPVLIIVLAIVALAAVVTAAALYRSARTAATAPAPQTVKETTVAAEPEVVERAQEARPEPPSIPPAEENGTTISAEPAREAGPRSEAPAREVREERVRKDDERRVKDEEKSAERARKEEQKEARREEKQAERLAEQQSEKREETRPRLVGIYTERRKP